MFSFLLFLRGSAPLRETFSSFLNRQLRHTRPYRPLKRQPAIAVLFGSALLFCFCPSSKIATAQSAQDWWQRSAEFRTRYYSVKTDLSEARAEHLGAHMDVTFESYRQLFAGLKSRVPRSMDLYLFKNQSDYHRVLEAKFKAVGTGSWGMAITRRGETSLVAWEGKYSLSAMESVLQHEGFHQFARYLFPKLPSWANEGLAEVFQRGVAVDGKIILGEVSKNDLRMLTAATKQRRFRSFSQFFTMDQRVWNQHVQRGEANTNYLQAWCMVHFFLYADQARHQGAFMDFLIGLNQELPWQEAFVRAFGSPNFSALEKNWLAYINGLQPVDYREIIRRLDFLAAGMKALHQQKVYPINLIDLQQALAKTKFTHTSNLFEKPRTMRADEAQNYQVPAGRQKSKQQAFHLVDTKGKPVAAPRDDKAAAKLRRRLTRQPLQIVTIGLEPKNLIVRWKRTGKQGLQPILEAQAVVSAVK